MASVYAWHGHLSGTSMEALGIEEGLLDETDNAGLMIDKLSTVGKAKHDWKELVNDPSLSEVEISESNKTQESYVKAGFGQKDWHHYLSAFSLNDEDTSNFMALETHTDHGQENFGVFDRTSGKEEHKKEDFIESKSVMNVVEKVENVTLPVVATIDGRKNIAESERGQYEEMLEQESSLKNSSHILERNSFPTTSKQNLVGSTNITDDRRSKPVVRPGSAPATVDDELNMQLGLMSGTTDIVHGLEKSSKSTRRPKSVPLQTSVEVDWQPLIQVDEGSNVNAHMQTEPVMQPSSTPVKEEMQTLVEERNILPADAKNVPNVMHNSSSNLSFTSLSETDKKNDKSSEKKTYQTQPKSSLNIQDNNYFAKQSSSVLRTHLSGDGKDENKSENGNVSDESDGKEEQYSAGVRLNTNSSSFNTQHTLRPDHTETSNVATSRETAENLPVRPLTIGDSLTIGTTLAYRPISPFESDIYPTGTSVPDVPSTTSVATTYLSSSQYSEGTLNEEREEDMSARERLQPLGRVGLEVKQGPPWGISMPLFQPHSRDSSLSSNDSNSSNTQFLQLQSTSSQQVKLETEPLQSMSSTPSETDLSRKASIKSLEPKEPMGVKVMSGAGNLKTPIGKFRQQNPVDGDSPVSKILGPTFKATQKMLEELQRRPLEAYDERLEQLPVENMKNTFEKETDLERERIVTDRRPNSRSYGDLESGGRGEINFVENEGSAQDTRRPHSREKIKTTPDSNQGTLDLTSVTTTNLVGVNSTHSSIVDDRPKSRESRPSRDIIQEFSTNQSTPNLTPITTAHLRVVDNNRSSVVGGLQGVPISGTYSKRKETNTPTGRFFSEGSITQSSYYDLTPISTANVLVDTTPSPVVPVVDGISERVAVNSHSRRNESHKTQQTSWMTDTTLGNSDGLSGYLVLTEVDKENEGGEISKAENLKSENRNDASDLSEFDRVASESISWSNAVASQFREEMKSVDLEGQQRFVDRRHVETSVNERDAIISFLDSGLSESSTNDEIYRPKRLTRLSPSNGPIGIYDVRQSSGPGSTNRRRLALGKKPRESSKSLQMRDIYVSDGTTGTSGTDRDSRQSRRVHGAVYVSEGTTSGAEPVHDNGMDSEPEGQSTPKSENISTRQSEPMTDTYHGFTKSDFEKPTTVSHTSFITYEIEKPARLSPPVFSNYKPTRQDSPSFSQFEINKFMRANVTVTSSNGTLSIEHKTNALQADQQKGGNFMRLQPSATVEHTWSISKPVMSQLSTGAVGGYQQPRTQQQVLNQPTTHQPGHRRKRAPRQKQIVSKTIQQHTKDQASDSMESEKNLDKNEKKSVADIILENMIAEEQKQKKRHKRLEVKQEQTTQDLNHLWERFQDVFGKKSRNSRRSKTGRRSVRQTADISPPSSSDIPSSENTNITRQSVDTDSDEEFERFLRRIRELQSSESSHQEDNGSTSSKLSSSHVVHNQSESTQVERLQRKPRHALPDSSTSMTSILSSDDSRAVRRTVSKVPSHELIPRKATRQNLDHPAVVSSSDTKRKSESPVSLPMWLSVKNKEMVKQGKTSSSSCTCGAKFRKEKQKTSGVRDIGVNCPTPPIQEFLPVTTDIDVLKAGSFEENISHPASLIKLSLQDAFMYSKQDFIDKSRDRVKKLKEKREERENSKMGSNVVVVVPSEKIRPKKENRKLLTEDRDTKPNKQFEQLQRKKPRPMTNKEIRDVNKRMYKNLPEVRKRKDEERRAEFYKTNRLRAQLYGKHVRNTNRIFTVA